MLIFLDFPHDLYTHLDESPFAHLHVPATLVAAFSILVGEVNPPFGDHGAGGASEGTVQVLDADARLPAPVFCLGVEHPGGVGTVLEIEVEAGR